MVPYVSPRVVAATRTGDALGDSWTLRLHCGLEFRVRLHRPVESFVGSAEMHRARLPIVFRLQLELVVNRVTGCLGGAIAGAGAGTSVLAGRRDRARVFPRVGDSREFARVLSPARAADQIEAALEEHRRIPDHAGTRGNDRSDHERLPAVLVRLAVGVDRPTHRLDAVAHEVLGVALDVEHVARKLVRAKAGQIDRRRNTFV